MESQVEFEVHKALIPKRGSEQGECEDAISARVANRRFAVADGATESFDSRRWARHIARAWTSLPPGTPTRNQYHEGLSRAAAHFAQRRPMGSVPWFIEAKAEQGSHATFLGIEFTPTRQGSGHWEATAVGDSCLFEFNAGVLVSTFPLQDPDSFDSHPESIASSNPPDPDFWASVRGARGFYGEGDTFILATDAVSQWLMRRLKEDAAFAGEFIQLLRRGGQPLIQEFEASRNTGSLRNDDIGLLLVECLTATASTAAQPLTG